MMPDSTFDQLAEEAAAGLQGDDELFLDVKQELRMHLEDKADDLRGQGHSAEESDALACKTFGSPLAVAAELVAAHAGRMRLRALARLVFLLLIVPLAIVLALYVGYDRFVGLSYTISGLCANDQTINKPLPKLPGATHLSDSYTQRAPLLEQLAGGMDKAANLRKYWEAHRQDPEAKSYYAYYAVFAAATAAPSYPNRNDTPPIDTHFVGEMQRGEQIEPQNALYNVLLAAYYLQRGILPRSEKSVPSPTDDVLDRRAFMLGIAELRRAAAKPYLHAYRVPIIQQKLNALPSPLLTEDYLERITLMASELFPDFPRYREMTRYLPGCARALLAEGHRADAEAVMDTWKPFTILLMDDSSSFLISAVVDRAIGERLATEGAEVYDRLGAPAKAREARAIAARLRALVTEWKATDAEKQTEEHLFREHGAYLAKVFLAEGLRNHLTEAELQPSRMHEHALIDEILVEGVILLLILALLASLAEGACWFFRLRKAGTRPLLLLPAGELGRALLLGIALPVAVYWLYSRWPGIGGREFGWLSHWPRFAAEWLCLAGVLCGLPAYRLLRYIDRRCHELGVVLPARGRVWWLYLHVGAVLVVALLFGGVLPLLLVLTTVYACFCVKNWPLAPRIGLVVLAVGVGQWIAYSGNRPIVNTMTILLAGVTVVAGLYTYFRVTNKYSRYFGTVALSLAPLFACSVLFLSLVVQPWFIANEVYWLRRDTAFWNHYQQAHQRPVGFNAVEEQATASYLVSLNKAMKGK